jgi:hypothetical protein
VRVVCCLGVENFAPTENVSEVDVTRPVSEPTLNKHLKNKQTNKQTNTGEQKSVSDAHAEVDWRDRNCCSYVNTHARTPRSKRKQSSERARLAACAAHTNNTHLSSESSVELDHLLQRCHSNTRVTIAQNQRVVIGSQRIGVDTRESVQKRLGETLTTTAFVKWVLASKHAEASADLLHGSSECFVEFWNKDLTAVIETRVQSFENLQGAAHA